MITAVGARFDIKNYKGKGKYKYKKVTVLYGSESKTANVQIVV